MQPLYTLDNTTAAYQLNWSVALFGTVKLPPAANWLNELKAATVNDGVRILEYHAPSPNVAQFLVSSKPANAPSDIVRSVKGRWQYLIRDDVPKAFRRNYSISSVGEANSQVLQSYVAQQPQRHPMADARVQERIRVLQFHDPGVELHRDQFSSHGRFIHNLQIVLENESGWNESACSAIICIFYWQPMFVNRPGA
jgi:hypothetical protein